MHQTVGASEETLAIIMPLYGHSGLVSEAIESIRRAKTFELQFEVVVSVDGDPDPALFEVLACEGVDDDRIHVIFAENGGPGAARNRAIDYALQTFPNLVAVYFLDADNRLLPSTLQKLWAHKIATKSDWVFTNIDAFSVNWTAHYGDHYSRLSHCITDNICDTASLVDASILRAGIRFDEDRRNGFEDWDFWLACVNAGYTGSKCPSAAFEYRLRSESRFREANRHRAQSLKFMRDRHKTLFRRDKLVGFEHQDAARYAVSFLGNESVYFLTDPNATPQTLGSAEFIQRYWASRAEPDNHHFPPFLICSSSAAYKLIQANGLLPNILSRLEQLCEKSNVVFVDLIHNSNRVTISHEYYDSGSNRKRPSDLLAVKCTLIEDIFRNAGLDWLRSITTDQIWPSSATLTVNCNAETTHRDRVRSSPEQELISIVDRLHNSVFRRADSRRWTWRPRLLAPSHSLYIKLRQDINGSPVLPIGQQRDGRKTAAILTPFASFGGAEKVVYAAARQLKKAGYETHLFVLGSDSIDLLDGLKDNFDYFHIWYEGIPRWGGDRRFLGHDLIDDESIVDLELLKGQLSGFDLIINNHVMAAHPIMGRLRAEGTRTACYLHLVDYTPNNRPAGHPYAAIAFEHAYDAFLTCSDALARYLRGFGVADRKIFPVENCSTLSMSADAIDRLRSERLQRQSGPIRLLYIGRFDVQKGIDRLYLLLKRLDESSLSYSARVVGGELLMDQKQSWGARLSSYAQVIPPVFSQAGLIEHLHWADATLLLSRWEGAPLVVREAQHVGSIPIAVNVGAVSEQIRAGEDGLIVEEGYDAHVVECFMRHVRSLRDEGYKRKLISGTIATSDQCTWETSFENFVAWAHDPECTDI